MCSLLARWRLRSERSQIFRSTLGDRGRDETPRARLPGTQQVRKMGTGNPSNPLPMPSLGVPALIFWKVDRQQAPRRTPPTAGASKSAAAPDAQMTGLRVLPEVLASLGALETLLADRDRYKRHRSRRAALRLRASCFTVRSNTRSHRGWMPTRWRGSST